MPSFYLRFIASTLTGVAVGMCIYRIMTHEPVLAALWGGLTMYAIILALTDRK